MSEENLNTTEAAKFLNISHDTMVAWRYQKIGPPYVKLGDTPKSKVVYRMADLKKWMADREVDNG